MSQSSHGRRRPGSACGRAFCYLLFLPLDGRCESAEPAAIFAGFEADDLIACLALGTREPVRIGGWAFRGLLSLPVQWDAG